MNCSEFLELYSDYRDGRLDENAVSREVREHLHGCDACMRYDAAICRGVMTLRSVDELEPSKRVVVRNISLMPETGETVSPTPAKFAGALLVAAAIALLVWPWAEEPEEAPTVAEVLPGPQPPAPALPAPKPLPVREIDPPARVFHAQLQPPPQQVTIAERVALPE